MSGIHGFVTAFDFHDLFLRLNSKFLEDKNCVFYFSVCLLYPYVPIILVCRKQMVPNRKK